MNSQTEPSSFILTRQLAGGQVEWIPLETPERMPAEPDATYALLDRAEYEAPQALVARRQGDDLVIEVQDAEVLVLTDFFAASGASFFPTTDIAGGAGPFGGAPITPDTQVVAGASASDQVVWSAEPSPEEAVAQAPQRDGDEDGAGSPMLWGGLAAGGLGLALAGAGGGGGGGGGGSPSPGDGADPDPGTDPEPVATSVEGRIVAGPVISGNGLSVTLFEADGTTQLGEAKVGADGSFSVDVGDYSGVVITRVVDADDGPDFRDEATGTDQDLDAALSGAIVVDGASATEVMNVNPLTTVAARLAEREAANGTPTPDEIADANAAVAELFGLSDLHTVTVEPLNGGGYDASDDLSDGETYGAILAAFSGVDMNNGGDSQSTIDAVLAGLTLNGDGEAELSKAVREQLLEGARTVERETGESLGDALSAALDEIAPVITSESAAPPLTENSGPDQVVYTATATDESTVTWSLANSGDAADFDIDATTGEVTLIADPDFETQSSYSFTVVATDAGGNTAAQTVSLDVNDLDEEAPTITSGTTADSVGEGTGSGQIVYTAEADDDSAVTWSLAGGGDAADFSIDPTTGAVVLTENPDFEEQSSYSFTVVATDAAGNSTRQTVSLAIEDRDDEAPFITSPATATIQENIGADQEIYTAQATDDEPITWSLADSGDAGSFSIDAGSGAVTLGEDPDHESQSSYQFTVVATDDAGNRSEQTVSLTVEDLDESAPTITSGATAAAIDENSGADQVIYTATSTDDGDISTGSTTYSLADEDDADDFSIDPASGAVTLTEDPDYETKPSYEFTVVATDAAGNATEQAVTLAINDVDEVSPSVAGIEIASADGAQNDTLNAGDTVLVNVTMSENTIVDTGGGVPVIGLTIGGTTVLADYVSGSATDTLVFEYTIQPGDADDDGIGVAPNSLDANGGTLTDDAGNAADLQHGAVPSDGAFMVDTAAPTLTASTPGPDAEDVAIGSDIVLTFSEAVQIGTGTITIGTDDDDGDTRIIDVTDESQVTVDGNQVIIDPAASFQADTDYNIRIDGGAFTDLAGNPYAGISDSDTLTFATAEPDASIVVFDLVEGASSDHSGRTFDDDESYDIYIRVDHDDATLITEGNDPGAWGTWSGAANLGSDDRVILVGDGEAVLGPFSFAVNAVSAEATEVAWSIGLGFDAARLEAEANVFVRATGTDTDSVVLFETSLPTAFFAGQGGQLETMYLIDMPAGILTSQGLV